MKMLFTAIRKCDSEAVKAILDELPGLISCISVGAPKKDEGQSSLQVALKSSSAEIVPRLYSNVRVLTDELRSDLSRIFKLLIEKGADVDYTTGKETFSCYKDHPVADFLKWKLRKFSNIAQMHTVF